MNYYCSGGASSKGVLLCHSSVCLQVTLKEKDISHKPLKVELWGLGMCVHSNTNGTTIPNQN